MIASQDAMRHSGYISAATILCNVRNTKLFFAESLEQGFMEFVFDRWKNLIIALFWKHNYFLLKVKYSQENLFKESVFKKWFFLNVMSATHSLQLVPSRSWSIFYICLNTLVEHFDI